MPSIIKWTVKYKDSGYYVIEFWTRADKSNAIQFKSVTMEAEKLRNKIVSITGHTNFSMEYIKPKDFLAPPNVYKRNGRRE